MMLQTYEATLEPSGQVWFTDFTKPVIHQRQKVLVTIVPTLAIQKLGVSANKQNTPQTAAMKDEPKPDWQAFAGVLKNAAAFAGDPLEIQRQLRSE